MAKGPFVKISGSIGLSNGLLTFRVSLSFHWLLTLMPRSEQWEYYFVPTYLLQSRQVLWYFKALHFEHTDCQFHFWS